MAGQAVISLDLAAVDRRFGSATAPEPREAVTLALPLPAAGQRKDIRGRLASGSVAPPRANLSVTVSLKVSDGIGQEVSAPMAMVLPGRRFFDPLAAALIEMRRDLLWSRTNAARSAEVLRAISWQPGRLHGQDALRGAACGAIGTLESGNLTDEARNKLAQVLWDAAVALEDGGLADALDRMQKAQERLSEAIRNGASPDEVQRLMAELQKATDDYIDMLAQQQGQDPPSALTVRPRTSSRRSPATRSSR